jgi:thioredoxin-related protein
MQTDPGVRERLARLERAELDFDDHTLALRVGEAHVSPFERARLWGIEATPGLVLLDADGRLLGAHTGLLPPDALIAVLDAALALTGS